jgi:hypothetical protein
MNSFLTYFLYISRLQITGFKERERFVFRERGFLILRNFSMLILGRNWQDKKQIKSCKLCLSSHKDYFGQRFLEHLIFKVFPFEDCG